MEAVVRKIVGSAFALFFVPSLYGLSLPAENVPLSRVITLRRDDEDDEDTAEGLHA